MSEKKYAEGYGDLKKHLKGGDRYLKLTSKLKEVIIRIISPKPVFTTGHWIGPEKQGTRVPCTETKTCKYCVKNIEQDVMVGWIVLDRNDENKVKIFSARPSVGQGISDLIMDEWGDADTFDIKVERTEQPGQYYKVSGLVKTIKTPLTDKEKKLVEDADFDLEKEMQIKIRDGADETLENIPEGGIDKIAEELDGDDKDDAPLPWEKPVEGEDKK